MLTCVSQDLRTVRGLTTLGSDFAPNRSFDVASPAVLPQDQLPCHITPRAPADATPPRATTQASQTQTSIPKKVTVPTTPRKVDVSPSFSTPTRSVSTPNGPRVLVATPKKLATSSPRGATPIKSSVRSASLADPFQTPRVGGRTEEIRRDIHSASFSTSSKPSTSRSTVEQPTTSPSKVAKTPDSATKRAKESPPRLVSASKRARKAEESIQNFQNAFECSPHSSSSQTLPSPRIVSLRKQNISTKIELNVSEK
jgi:hypothetical protein